MTSLAQTHPDHSDWLRGVAAQSDNYELLSDAPVDAEALLRDLETFRQAVLTDLRLDASPDERPLRLTIIDDPDTFDIISPGGITAAIYLQSAVGHDIVIGYSSEPGHLLSDALEPGWLRLVLRHEVVHHLLETRYARKLPIWLGEGLAEYYSTFRSGAEGQVTFGHALPEQEELSVDQAWLPMRTVIESMGQYPDFRIASSEPLYRAQRIYYGQSWALAHFVMDQPDGLANIHRFVDGWNPETDSEDSFERAFGMRYAPLEARIRDDIVRDGGNLRLHDMPPATRTNIIMRTPSQTELTENKLRLLLTHGRASDRTLDRIDVIEARLDGQSTQSENRLDLARALNAWRQTDWDGSDAAANRVLDRHPGHPIALKLKAKTAYGRVSERQTDERLWDAAEAAAIRALAASPQDAELHLFRVAVSLPEKSGLSTEAIASLDWLTTRDTHLRLPHTAMMMIPALIYEDRFDYADRVLDNAARWTTDPSDKWVIDRLRGNVAAERAAQAE